QQRIDVDKGTATLDLAFDLFDVPEGLIVRVEYSTDLFEHSAVQRMLGHFRSLIDELIVKPEARISDLQILTAAERHELLVDWNRTAQDFPRDATIHSLVAEQAGRTPDAVAVQARDGELTYRELDRRSDQLAFFLQSQGIEPEARVAVCIERSLEM